ncbi:MAG: hypothetical protein AB1445_10125 [Bacillota bacterium]
MSRQPARAGRPEHPRPGSLDRHTFDVTLDSGQQVVDSDCMFRAEVMEGSGKKALEQGRVSPATYWRAVSLLGEPP